MNNFLICYISEAKFKFFEVVPSFLLFRYMYNLSNLTVCCITNEHMIYCWVMRLKCKLHHQTELILGR